MNGIRTALDATHIGRFGLPQTATAKYLAETSRTLASFKAMTSAHVGRLADLSRGTSTATRIAEGAIASINRINELSSLSSVARAFAPIGRFDNLFSATKWARELGKGFDIGISRSILDAAYRKTAMAAVGSSDSLSFARMVSPGFGILSSLGLSGAVARGAVADLLQHYDESNRAVVFGAVAEAIEVLDRAEQPLDELVPGIERAWHAITLALNALPKSDVVGRKALYALIILLLTVYTAVSSYATLVIQRAGPTAIQIEKLMADVDASRADADARHADDREHVRYLGARAPLRTAPNGHATMIRVVYPDQLVRVREAQGDWAYVEVYDYQSDQPISGWINRRHLRRQS